MNNELKPKYGLITAICLVVGIVVGTGVFFNGRDVLNEVNGDLTLSTLAWAIGGIVMLISIANFTNFSLKYGNINSMSDFAKVTVNNKFGFIVGVFAKYIYFPAMTATISFVVGMYFTQASGLISDNFPFSAPVFIFAFIFMSILTLTNLFAPKIASILQVSTTIIKLIPLILMGLGGLFIGLYNGTLNDNFNFINNSNNNINNISGNGFFAAICATCFSFEGWICATNVGKEIKNKERNMPIALISGSIIVIAIYILYNLGISGAIDSETLLGFSSSSEAVSEAFNNLFGSLAGKILIWVVVISAIGTLNGIVMANSRSSYALAINNEGIFKREMLTVTKRSNVPLLSTLLGYFLASLWLIYYYFSQTNDLVVNNLYPKGFPFDLSELPIITTYILYIPMYISFLIKNKDLNIFRRILLPILGISAAIIMIIAAIFRHQLATLYYLIFFIIVIAIALLIDYLAKKRRLKIMNNSNNN